MTTVFYVVTNGLVRGNVAAKRRRGMHGELSLSRQPCKASVLRMKNLKSLQVVALAGVAVALTAGCSSTSSSHADYNSSDANAAYRFTSAGGWVPVTDITKMAVFPQGWVPGGVVSYESYTFAPPVDRDAVGGAAVTTSSASSSTTISTDGSQTIVSSEHPTTTVTVPADQSATTTTIASDGSSTTVTTSSPAFSENLQPGDTFVEAAGADSDTPKVRRVILYTPFGAPGVH